MATVFGQEAARRGRATASAGAETPPLLMHALWCWRRAHASHCGAAWASYAMGAVVLLALGTLSLLGGWWGADAAHGLLSTRLQPLVGHPLADALQGVLAAAARDPALPVVGAVAAMLLALCIAFGSAPLRHALQSMSSASRLPTMHRPVSAGALLAAPLLSLGLLVSALGALAGSVVLMHTAASATSDLLTPTVTLDLMASLAFFSAGFAALLRSVPQAAPSMPAAWMAGSAAALVFCVGKQGLAAWLARGSVSGFALAWTGALVLLGVAATVQVLLFAAALAFALDEQRCERVDVRRFVDSRLIIEQPLPAHVAAPASLAAARSRGRVTPLTGRRRNSGHARDAGAPSAVLLQFPDRQVRRREPRA